MRIKASFTKFLLPVSFSLACMACNGGGSGGNSNAYVPPVDTLTNEGNGVYYDSSTGVTYNYDNLNNLYDVDNADYTAYEGGNEYYDPGNGAYVDIVNSVAGQTKDTELQRANLQQADLNTRAQFLATKFQMSVDSATQLAQLSDRVQAMTKQGQMTAADRGAVTTSAMAIAGVSIADVNKAFSQTLQGDDGAVDDLLTKAAGNLGMPSAAVLRDQLLPALGVSLK